MHWTTDFAEAHIVEGLLRAHGLRAWAFDTAFVRQDWFRILAYGGYRVMVVDADAEEALRLVAAYRMGECALPDQDVDRPGCPRCAAGGGVEDPRPRRLVFALLIAFDLLLGALFALASSPVVTGVTLSVLLAAQLLLICPGVAAYLVRCRYRCATCNTAWRSAPALAFPEMTQAVEAADVTSEGRPLVW